MNYRMCPDGVDDGEQGAVQGEHAEREQPFLSRLACSLINIQINRFYKVENPYHIDGVNEGPAAPDHGYLVHQLHGVPAAHSHQAHYCLILGGSLL